MSTDWRDLTARVARSIQTTVGWIFWDPGAVARYQERGVPQGLGYMAARGAPFAHAGPQALTAAWGSISPEGITFLYNLVGDEGFSPFWEDRNDAVREGLTLYAPAMNDILANWGPRLWDVIKQLPFAGRPFSASHLDMARADDPVLDGWHAVNILREWRGDTHWALVAVRGLSGGEASILHNEWLRYDGNWLSLSRGQQPADIERAWAMLATKGLARDGVITHDGLRLRQELEDETDRATSLPWQILGAAATTELCELLEPPCALLLERVNLTAGVRYQPGSRVQQRYDG